MDRRVQMQLGKHMICCSSNRGHRIGIRTRANVGSSWMRAWEEAGVWVRVLGKVMSRTGTGVEGGCQGSLKCSFKLCPLIVSDFFYGLLVGGDVV